ncbi:MAG: hypothetical protein H6Q15_2007 [Bacteroidetes bacterium]|nr:hypothetical protein [Bacteroidota bacterium]
MNKIIIGVFITLSLLSCGKKSDNVEKAKANDIENSINKDDRDKSLLQGIWATSKEENASFIIEGNKIEYFEVEDTSFHYQLKDNIYIVMSNNDTISSYKVITLTKDSLVMMAKEGNIITLIKIIE